MCIRDRRKGVKLYMPDPVVVEDQSITTAGKQKLVIDRKEMCIRDRPQAEDVPQSWLSYFTTKPGEVKAMYPRRKKEK